MKNGNIRLKKKVLAQHMTSDIDAKIERVRVRLRGGEQRMRIVQGSNHSPLQKVSSETSNNELVTINQCNWCGKMNSE